MNKIEAVPALAPVKFSGAAGSKAKVPAQISVNAATTRIRVKYAKKLKSFFPVSPIFTLIISPIDFPSCLTEANSAPQS